MARPALAALTAEAHHILALAWPVMLTGINWTILHVTDVVVVGLTCAHQVAALGASRTIAFFGIVIGIGALSGILVHATRADGARDLRSTVCVLHQGMALALGLARATRLFLLALPLLEGVGVAPRAAPTATHTGGAGDGFGLSVPAIDGGGKLFSRRDQPADAWALACFGLIPAIASGLELIGFFITPTAS